MKAERVLQAAAKIAQENARRNAHRAPRSLAELVKAAMPRAIATPEEISAYDERMDRRRREARIAEANSLHGIPPKYSKVPLEPDWEQLPERINVADDGQRAKWSEVREPYSRAFRELTVIENTQGGAIFALVGDRGPGKTWMSCCLIKRFCADARFAMYCEALDYFVTLRGTYGDRGRGTEIDVEAKYLRPELLAIDAMEEKSETPSQQQMLTRLINKRLVAEKLTLLISNDNGQTLPDRIGRSLADRLNDGGGMIECTWPSLRGRI